MAFPWHFRLDIAGLGEGAGGGGRGDLGMAFLEYFRLVCRLRFPGLALRCTRGRLWGAAGQGRGGRVAGQGWLQLPLGLSLLRSLSNRHSCESDSIAQLPIAQPIISQDSTRGHNTCHDTTRCNTASTVTT